MIERQRHMSRAVRTARGSLGALFATLLAAASHAIAGGTVTGFALLATTAVTLPLCVALSGRIASLWRLALAVSVSQFLYHWTFAGLSLPPATSTSGQIVSPHAAHMFDQFIPIFGSGAAAADLWMWIAHGVTALVTVAMLYRGEVAVMGLARILRRSLSRIRTSAAPTPIFVAPSLLDHHVELLSERLTVLSAISYRGPPQPSALQ